MNTKLGVSLLINDAFLFLNFINGHKYVTNALNSLFSKLINKIYELCNKYFHIQFHQCGIKMKIAVK
jgi:hypothetical protein